MLNYLYAKMRCNNKITALVLISVITYKLSGTFLPFCTSFRKKKCPDLPFLCIEEKQVDIERHLRSILRRMEK